MNEVDNKGFFVLVYNSVIGAESFVKGCFSVGGFSVSRVIGKFIRRFALDQYRNVRKPVLILFNALFLMGAYSGSILLRFEFDLSIAASYFHYSYIAPYLIIGLAVLQFHRQLFGWWRYTSIHDLNRIIRASAESQALFLIFMSLVFRMGGYPRSLYILNFFLIICFIGGGRLVTRAVWEALPADPTVKTRRTVLIGAGQVGQLIVRELRRNLEAGLTPVAFVDDDPEKNDHRFQGIMNMGSVNDLPDVIRKTSADVVMIAIAFPSTELIGRIIELSSKSGVDLLHVPGLGTNPNIPVCINGIKEFQTEDLLGRKQLNLLNNLVKETIAGKRVLVTGAAGSIGSELCRQIARFAPASIILFDNSENSLFYLNHELQAVDTRVIPCLGDVTDEGDLARLFMKYRPEVVFHAAAYKHVPLAEANPFNVIKNNVLGMWRMTEAIKTYGAEKFVLISTDKAVKPENIMGATKRVAELMVLGSKNLHRNGCAVRFGNVLGSTGSVVPTFNKMISEGGPVQITHPDIERYFMTIPEAVQLVLQAATLNGGGDLYVLDMGDPVRIMDLAKNMIRLSGLEPDKDIKIEITGLRPGEKIAEKLYSEDEILEDSKHPTIRRISNPDYDYSSIDAAIGRLIAAIVNEDESTAIRELCGFRDMINMPDGLIDQGAPSGVVYMTPKKTVV